MLRYEKSSTTRVEIAETTSSMSFMASSETSVAGLKLGADVMVLVSVQQLVEGSLAIFRRKGKMYLGAHQKSG